MSAAWPPMMPCLILQILWGSMWLGTCFGHGIQILGRPHASGLREGLGCRLGWGLGDGVNWEGMYFVAGSGVGVAANISSSWCGQC